MAEPSNNKRLVVSSKDGIENGNMVFFESKKAKEKAAGSGFGNRDDNDEGLDAPKSILNKTALTLTDIADELSNNLGTMLGLVKKGYYRGIFQPHISIRIDQNLKELQDTIKAIKDTWNDIVDLQYGTIEIGGVLFYFCVITRKKSTVY